MGRPIRPRPTKPTLVAPGSTALIVRPPVWNPRSRKQGKRCVAVESCQANGPTIVLVGCRLTDKGQITLPRHVRDGLGLRPGDEVEFVAEGGGYRLRKVLRTNPFARY